MRTCHVAFLGYPGRAGAVIYELTQLEARHGLDVTALVAGLGASEIEESEENGVHVVRIPAPTTSARSPAKLRFIRSACDYLAKHQFDVVIVYSSIGIGALPLLLGSKRKDSVWVHHIRSGPITGGAVGWVGRKMLRLESNAFDTVFIQSAGTRRMLFGQKRQESLIVIGGANLRRFQPSYDPDLRSQLGVPADACLLVYASFLHSTRKTETILLAARDLVFTRGHDNIRLAIIGEGPDLERLQALAAEYGLQQHVLFLGRVQFDKMPSYYSVADIGIGYVTNSFEYGPQPPLKTAEMLGCGLAVVATNTEGNQTFIRNGVNGILVEDTTEGLARGIEELIVAPQLRAQFSACARSSVEQFDFQRMVPDAVIPEYKRLVQAKRSKQRGSRQS